MKKKECEFIKSKPNTYNIDIKVIPSELSYRLHFVEQFAIFIEKFEVS